MEISITKELPHHFKGWLGWDVEARWFLAWDNNILLGIGGLQLNESGPYMGPSFVFPDCRGKGVQKFLIKERIKWCVKNYYFGLTTCAYDDNLVSISNILKCGFEERYRKGNEVWFYLQLENNANLSSLLMLL